MNEKSERKEPPKVVVDINRRLINNKSMFENNMSGLNKLLTQAEKLAYKNAIIKKYSLTPIPNQLNKYSNSGITDSPNNTYTFDYKTGMFTAPGNKKIIV